MTQVSRRVFNQGTLGSLLTFSLLESLFAGDAFAAKIKPVAANWLASLNQTSQELKGKKLSQLQWQGKVEELFKEVDLPDLLKFVDFDKLTANLKFRDKGELSLRAKFPEVEGLPTKLVFGHQTFALKKGRSVVPHGHNNMATAFLVLKGKFEGKHYDRLEDQARHFIIKPTIDSTFSVGQYSTVSDHKDNIHWFKATSESGYIFNIHVLNVVEGKGSGRVYLDPKGEPISGGRIRARKIRAAEAYKLYG